MSGTSLPNTQQEVTRLKDRLAEIDKGAPKPFTVVSGWAICPECKQSSTGKYAGSCGCQRCGWTQRGGLIRGKTTF